VCAGGYRRARLLARSLTANCGTSAVGLIARTLTPVTTVRGGPTGDGAAATGLNRRRRRRTAITMAPVHVMMNRTARVINRTCTIRSIDARRDGRKAL
jgi:hypothetical protein